MVLSYNGCIISIEDDLIKCSYPDRFVETKWKMVLNERDICLFTDKKKERSFKIDEILEFQFEMGNGGGRNQDLPACIAYIILKTDTDPKDFFYFFIYEEYVLLNQTKAYDFGSKILGHISQRYDIPATYKLSIDTKKKRKAIAMVPLLLIIIMIWLRLRFG
ncbi:hypothetical protein [Mucilaginibacter flavus]|uniref:hypothetical protein n=1 Tax=Mucilaginibacter flavus TaxID=931504 RepID=UPI0025B2E46D|nr:hypothetical protein [Mucilaginibacter flavus]MDN3579575.1 hypothetical protein [Mucilaginibacter flavus]